MAEMQTYKGSCHCGKVSFEADIKLESGVACNCSICSRKGTLLTFVPATGFKLQQGEGELTEYRFNKNVIAHTFCKICGVSAFARANAPDGTPTVAINIRCLEGIDLAKVPVYNHDGRSA